MASSSAATGSFCGLLLAHLLHRCVRRQRGLSAVLGYMLSSWVQQLVKLGGCVVYWA